MSLDKDSRFWLCVIGITVVLHGIVDGCRDRRLERRVIEIETRQEFQIEQMQSEKQNDPINPTQKTD